MKPILFSVLVAAPPFRGALANAVFVVDTDEAELTIPLWNSGRRLPIGNIAPRSQSFSAIRVNSS
jgi:hypothetical protein